MAARANQSIALSSPGDWCPYSKVNICFETFHAFHELLQTVPWASEPPEYRPQVVVNFEVEDREVTEEATCRP